MEFFKKTFFTFLAVLLIPGLLVAACGGDEDEEGDDDDDDDDIDRHQECLDNIGDCVDATSSTCDLCPDDETAQDLWHGAQSEIGNVYCHSCGENEDGDSTMRAFSTGVGCLDEATILGIFCE